ncbi:MAG TPA: DNA polymerase III subunit delta' [Xanthomonadales bacterium]|nr:DNA polymerase III subunit delta' [Xanthomonadales bacterium]
MNYPWLEPALQEFRTRLRNDRLAHACLLSGPRGLGKTDLAQRMVATLLCLQGGETECGVCRSCQLLRGGAHPDFRLISYEINPKTDKLRTAVVIEQVRELNSVIHLTHALSPRKVVLINPAEAMNRNTANALLKTLEEPPGDGVVLLVSHDPSRLPATIRSRCQSINVRLPDEAMALRWLLETTGAKERFARDALCACAGSPLLAQSMLASGDIEHFRAVGRMLERVQADETAVGEVLETCAAVDQEGLWNWISLLAAQRLRACFGLGAQESAATRPAGAERLVMARRISRLQSLADENRRAQKSPLRKDLLLRDWLIQWSRLASS